MRPMRGGPLNRSTFMRGGRGSMRGAMGPSPWTNQGPQSWGGPWNQGAMGMQNPMMGGGMGGMNQMGGMGGMGMGMGGGWGNSGMGGMSQMGGKNLIFVYRP
jgi:hypothetical protein